MTRLAAIAIAALLLAACKAYKISNDTNAVGGIPFYTQKSVIKQTTVYDRTWLNITLDYTDLDDDRAPISGSERSQTLMLAATGFDSIEFRTIFEATQTDVSRDGELDFDAYLNAFEAALQASCVAGKNCAISTTQLAAAADSRTLTPAILLQSRISDATALEKQIDYSTPYYFNVRAPLFGTADTSLALSQDGTLSEAASSIDSSQLADLIPLKELLADKWGLENFFDAGNQVAPAQRATPLKSYSLALSIETDGYRYSLVKYHQNTGAASDLNRTPLNFSSAAGAMITRSRFASDKPPQAAKATNDENAIKIDGTITLPGAQQ